MNGRRHLERLGLRLCTDFYALNIVWTQEGSLDDRLCSVASDELIPIPLPTF